MELLHRIGASLYMFTLPLGWEGWDRFSTLCSGLVCIASWFASSLLCTVEGDEFWTLALTLELGGLLGLMPATEGFWSTLNLLLGSRMLVFEDRARSALPRYVGLSLKTVFATCSGGGSIAAVRRGFGRPRDIFLARSFAIQFLHFTAQTIAASVLLASFVFFVRNIVLIGSYRAVIRLQRMYAKAYIKPRQVTVSNLGDHAPGECIVCLGELSDDDGRGLLRLICGHVFHVDCIDGWLNRREACPLCRGPVRNLRGCVLLRQKDVPTKPSPAISDASTAATDDRYADIIHDIHIDIFVEPDRNTQALSDLNDALTFTYGRDASRAEPEPSDGDESIPDEFEHGASQEPENGASQAGLSGREILLTLEEIHALDIDSMASRSENCTIPAESENCLSQEGHTGIEIDDLSLTFNHIVHWADTQTGEDHGPDHEQPNTRIDIDVWIAQCASDSQAGHVL